MNCRKSLHVGRLLKVFRSERFCHSKKDRELISFSQRTHHCGELGCAHVGQLVKLCGWVQHNRMTGQFLALRDAHGVTQVTFTKNQDPVVQSVAKDLPLESVVMVTGTVNSRPAGQENQNMKTGTIEVEAESIELLGPCTNNLPFQVNEAHKVKESLRMEYRCLDFRSNKMQRNLRLRSQIIMKMREFLCNKHGFVDVETPALFRRTPGGAREFVVPTHQPGHFYTLPQSPQQFKQLLMVGAIDRYMQIAKCFRDEGAKPDRQPEFTQVDLEMSFVTQEDIKQLVEHIILESWPEENGKIDLPFPRLSYQQAMDWYGSDKPDTRFGMKIKEITDTCHDWEVAPVKHVLSSPTGCVKVFCCPGGATLLSNKDVADIWNKAGASGTKDDAGLWHAQLKVREGRLQGGLVKHLSDHQQSELLRLLEAGPDNVIFILAGDHRLVPEVLGKARLEAANALEAKGEVIRPEGQMNLLWVEDFPLFLPKEDGTEGLESAHHPFTAPHPDHRELLYSDPAMVKGQHYDLVLNGSEIGGGSIRINDAKIQRYVLEEVLQEDPAPLEHLIQALEFGCPPHGGIALGLDRLLAIICQAPSIRDVIAFPKSSEGRDMMAKAPATITPEDYKYYHIKTTDNTQS